jgi:hypothetical protein
MGYHTEFTGQFTLAVALTEAQAEYLTAFNQTRRMKRDPQRIDMPDPVREAVGLPLGLEGDYFVGSTADYGQNRTPDVVDGNRPPQGQPGLWCQWTPTDDRTGIEWDGGEKFYNYVEWINYIIGHFLRPWGHSLSGEVTWSGEDASDMGKIRIENNVVKVLSGYITYR